MEPSKIYHLTDRCVLRVAGPEAFDFLQKIITNDLSACSETSLAYTCLLTPQGQVLFDFFVWMDEEDGGFFLDVWRVQAQDLLKRLRMYKLRAKVVLEETALNVCASLLPVEGEVCFRDPRLEEMGLRLYTPHLPPQAVPERAAYQDHAILMGVPLFNATIYGRDFMSNVNLDLLNAVSFTKGCFVGQEVAARIEHRGLVKKRLMVVEGSGLAAGDALVDGETEVAIVRDTDSSGKFGLALVKLLSVQGKTAFLNARTNTTTYLKPCTYFL